MRIQRKSGRSEGDSGGLEQGPLQRGRGWQRGISGQAALLGSRQPEPLCVSPPAARPHRRSAAGTHTVALQRTPTAAPASSLSETWVRGAENTRRVGALGTPAARREPADGVHSQPPAGVSGQESLVLSRTSLTAGRAAHSALQHPLSRPVPPHHTQVGRPALRGWPPTSAGPSLAPAPAPAPQEDSRFRAPAWMWMEWRVRRRGSAGWWEDGDMELEGHGDAGRPPLYYLGPTRARWLPSQDYRVLSPRAGGPAPSEPDSRTPGPRTMEACSPVPDGREA